MGASIQDLPLYYRQQNQTSSCALRKQSIIPGIACKLAFIPMVATCHRSELNPYAPSKTNTIIKSCTTRFVSVSHNRQTLLINALNIKPNKCRVIHGGTIIDKKPNIDTIRLAKEQLGLNSTNTILFSAGHLGKIKGHQHTIQALEQLVAEQPNTMLYIAGTGSADEKAQIEATIAHCKLESHVTLLGQISNIKQWILSADIFVQPSIEEAFGLVFIEAGACAKPVIATAVGGIVDIINEETGILVPPSSPSSLSKALNTLIKNKALRDMLGDNAYQRISNLFSLDKMINSYDELFKSLRK